MSLNQAESAAERIKKSLVMVKDWSLKTRIQWLRWFSHVLTNRKNLILKAVATDKKESEHQILINEYMPVGLLCNYYSRQGEEILKNEDRSRLFSLSWGNKRVIVKKEPLGIVGVITPSNHPFSLPTGTIISALLGGNGVIWKPAPETLAANSLVEDLIKETLKVFGADGLFESLPAHDDFGRELVQCPSVDKIHFTGSTKIGLEIRRQNALIRSAPP